MKTIAFFNNKGGVGKTSLVYHLAWMYSDLGLNVLAVDLDPQANLSSVFLEEDRFEELWPEGRHRHTVLGAIEPLLQGVGDIRSPHVETIADNLGLVVGDLGLSSMEDELSTQWPACLAGKERAFRVISAFHRLIALAAEDREADLVLIDVGPNLGAINRAAIIAAQHVVVPLSPDLFSLQGLRNLGPTLRTWRKGWRQRLPENPEPELDLPQPGMKPIGYVIQQHSIRMDRPVQAYGRWMDQIPQVYRESVLGTTTPHSLPSVKVDSHCLALVKHYRSLMPMAMEARKPIFHLKPADGAIGAHSKAVLECHRDYQQLAQKVADKVGLVI